MACCTYISHSHHPKTALPPNKPLRQVEEQLSEREHTITVAMLKELDALYEDAAGVTPIVQWQRQQLWGFLVEELRQIRRLVEAGVTVRIEGTPTVLRTWQDFYTWAHGRYHNLEDGYDRWIGDDR